MHRRRIVISLVLLILALVIGISGAVYETRPRDLVVPIDRTILEAVTDNQKTVVANKEINTGEEARSRALMPAPDARLIEKTPSGLLPRRAENGDRPADIYARPFELMRLSPAKPKLSLVLMQAGISETLTAEAYLVLPADVSFVLSPYAEDAERQMRDIRNRGHEVYLGITSDVDADSREDRGPYALDPLKSHDQNRDHLLWAMTRFTGYVGLVSDMTAEAHQNTLLREMIESEVKLRGLTLLPVSRRNSQTFDDIADRTLEAATTIKLVLAGYKPSDLDQALRHLTRRLQNTSRIIIFIEPGPLAIDILNLWLKTHQSRTFDLLPLSALMRLEEQG